MGESPVRGTGLSLHRPQREPALLYPARARSMAAFKGQQIGLLAMPRSVITCCQIFLLGREAPQSLLPRD